MPPVASHYHDTIRTLADSEENACQNANVYDVFRIADDCSA